MIRVREILLVFLVASVKCTFKDKNELKAFKNIAKALHESNHEVSVISVNGLSVFIEFAVLPNFNELNVPHTVVAFENLNSPKYKGINVSAVIAFDSVDSLVNFNNETFTKKKSRLITDLSLKSDYYYPFKFYVYCPGMTKADLLLLKDNPKPRDIVSLRYEYFIVNEGDFINIWTFVWYTPEKCDLKQLILVNQFSTKTQVWRRESFSIKKFENFHGCLLQFSFNINFPEYVEGSSIEKGRDCAGFLCETAKALSKNMNFSYKSLERLASDGIAVHDVEIDFAWNIMLMGIVHEAKTTYHQNYFYSIGLHFDEIFIVIPKGEDLDSYERIVLPFDDETWICLTITFAAAFAAIFVVKFMNNHVQDFVLGRETLTPGLNVLRVFFGISQIKCPEKNCPRFLVMSFILFCLVIRTGYQGKMFEFLQKDLKKPTFDSVDELIDKKFTFHMRNNFMILYANTDLAQRYINDRK